MQTLVNLLLLSTLSAAYASPSAVDDLLTQYQRQGAGPFPPESGQTLWLRSTPDPRSGQKRSCTSCHGTDPRSGGRHERTGKPIAPIAPSANPERLGQVAKIEKWLLRNCKWTFGGECTPQEKGDILAFLRTQ